MLLVLVGNGGTISSVHGDFLYKRYSCKVAMFTHKVLNKKNILPISKGFEMVSV